MKNSSRGIRVLLILLVITISVSAQDYNRYQSTNAVMAQVNGNVHTERIIQGTIVSLSNSTGLLKVRLYIPYSVLNYTPPDDSTFSSPGLLFLLRMNINPWRIQQELTSAKVFTAQGFLTLNTITKPVTAEYIPFPAGPDQEGDFNLSMTIHFNAADFNLDEKNKNPQFIIKIGEAVVNRI